MTFISKFVFPVLWAAFFFWAGVMLYTGQVHGVPVAASRWLALAALFFASVVFWARDAPIKRVIVDDGFLRISNYATEITVPFTEVCGAGFDGGPRNPRAFMILEFRNQTAFGRSIRFQPESDEAIELLRARLRPELGAEKDPEAEAAAEAARGRGMV